MTVTVKKSTANLVVPPSVRRQAGIKAGDHLEFRVSPRKITIVARPAPAGDEYTPRQRRRIDRELAKGLADIEAGRTFGPFDSADEFARAIEAYIKESRRSAKRSKPAR